jgi:hypothetical protein
MSDTLCFEGQLPESDVIGTCQAVFNELVGNPAAIADLSLPPVDVTSHSFEKVLSRIKFCFQRFDHDRAPLSYTAVSLAEPPFAVANIHYTKRETETPEIIHARILHEATHALRFAIISLYNELPGAFTGYALGSTPDKPHMDMRFEKARAEVPLYKLENPHFHAGYYMEHVLLGGVWAALYGYVLDAEDKMVSLPPNGMLFKVERRLARKLIQWRGRGGYFDFTELEGCGRDGVKTSIYHYGHRITGHDENERCIGHD